MKSIFSIFILISLFFLLTAESCDRSGTALKTVKASSYLLGTQDTAATMSWEKVFRFDPYNGGNYHTYEKYETTITLKTDGSYEEKDPENFTTGKYYLNKTKTAIAFVPEIVNGQEQREMDEELMFRHEIIKFTEDSLILAWQGRHGMVKDGYVMKKLED
jgi:hypothetical protein